jgi:hypothetical protein
LFDRHAIETTSRCRRAQASEKVPSTCADDVGGGAPEVEVDGADIAEVWVRGRGEGVESREGFAELGRGRREQLHLWGLDE